MAETIKVSTANAFAGGRGSARVIDGRTELWWDGFEYTPKDSDSRYQVKQNDTVDGISYIFYSQKVSNYQDYFWAIVGANSDKIINAKDITDLVGEVIIIPDINDYQLIESD